MMSKNSFLVRLRENGRRRYWVFVICFLTLLIAMPLRMLTVINGRRSYSQWMGKTEFAKYMMHSVETLFLPNTIMLILICAAAILCGLQGYSYLFNRIKVDMYHSQPVKKSVRFLAIYSNGAAYFILSYLINLLLEIGVAAYYHYLTDTLLAAALLSGAFQMIAFLAIYNTVILVVMLTGNYLSFSLGIGAFLGMEWGIRELVCMYSGVYFQTFSSKSENALKTPVFSVATIFLQAVRNVRLYKDSLSCGWILEQMGGYMVRVAIIGALTLLLSWIAYYYRAEESCTKTLVFSWMRPVVKLVAVVFAALTSGWIMSSMTEANLKLTIAALLGGALLTHCVLQIIFDSHFKAVLGRWWELLIGAAVAFGIFAGFQWDILGYDSHIPAESSVESTAVMFNAQEMDQGFESRNYYEDHMFLQDYNLIGKLVAADFSHQTGEKLTEMDMQEANYSQLTVLYRMKNGKKKYRTYYIDMTSQAELMQRILSDEAYKKGIFPILEEDYLEQKGEVEIRLDSYQANWGEISSANAGELVDALRKDLEGYDFETVSKANMIGTLQIGTKYSPDAFNSQPVTDYYAIYDTFENTIALLEKQGYVDLSTDVRSRVTRLTVSYSMDEGKVDEQQYFEDTYTDPQLIGQILTACDDTTYGTWWKDLSQYESNVYVYGNTESGIYVNFSVRKGEKLPAQVAEDIHYAQ